MGILSNTVSICQFKVMGEKPEGDFFNWASSRLSKYGFSPIENDIEELSVGWVHLDDSNAIDFSAPSDFFREHYLTMTLRKDQRRIPGVLLKANMEKAEQEFLLANPGYKKVPKDKRNDLLEAVKASLFARTLPSPSTYDAVWDTTSGILSLATLSNSGIELFTGFFRDTFELDLSLIHPYSRANSLISQELQEKLGTLNQAKTDDCISLINGNLWMGWEFLLWLMYHTMNETSLYKVNQEGPLNKGDDFVAYIDEKLVLIGEDERGKQKVAVSGPQSHFNEVRTALQDKKQIADATIFFEVQEETWKVTLKGDRFYLAGFKSPPVKIEKDELTDMAMEKEAVFYEKMLLMEKGMQLLDSLYYSFLSNRLSAGWNELAVQIQKWIEKS